MSPLLLHFPLSNIPEISGVFREKRVIFNELTKPTQDAETTNKDEKILTLSQAVENTKTALQSLKDAVNAEKNDKIDTDKEKEELATFLTAHKALDGLMGKLSQDTQSNISPYNSVLNSLENQENLTQIEAVHTQIISQIQEDTMYVEAMKVLKAVKKEGQEKVKEVLTEQLTKVLKKETWNTDDTILILQSLGLTHGQIISDSAFEKLTIPAEMTNFSDKIENIFTEKNAEKENDKNTNKKLVFSDTEGLVFKTDLEISEMQKPPKSTEKKEAVPAGSLQSEINTIQKNRAEYKKVANGKLEKMGIMGKALGYLGIDLSDPSQDNVLYAALRFIFDIPSPDEDKNYKYESSDKIVSDVINPFLKQAKSPIKIPIGSLSDAQISSKAKKILTGETKLKGETVSGKISGMAQDILGRIPETKIVSVSSGKMKVQLPKKSTAPIQMDALMKNSGGSILGTASGIFSGFADEMVGKISALDLGKFDATEFLPNFSEEDSSLEKKSLTVRKQLGYPKITGYSLGKGNVATIRFDPDETESDSKKSTIPKSTDVGGRPF